MQYSAKVTDYQKNIMLNICDAELVGKNIVQEKLTMNISESYYGGELVDAKNAAELLKNSSIINMVGENIISLSIKLGIGSENGIKLISGIPFLLVFKM